MSVEGQEVVDSIFNLLNKDYRGVNLAVYALATAGLAVSIHRIRPVSKFSKASKVPEHFIKRHELLKGTYSGVQPSPLRVLVDHHAPIYLPLWHSKKPPLPVKLWGVEIVSGNAVNWLECVAKGKRVTLKPISRDNEDLVSTVLLHLPQQKAKTVETIDIGQKLVEFGFAKVTVPKEVKKNSLEYQLAPALLSAEARAKNYRNGVWSDLLPPLPIYIVYWRKGSAFTLKILAYTSKKVYELLAVSSKSAFTGAKKLLWRSHRPPKTMQTT